MKRLVPALVPLALLISACAVGEPKPTTYVSDTGATLNAKVHSSITGPTEFWWRYGTTTEYGLETPHRTVDVTSTGAAYPVSQPISGLNAGTAYHVQLCVADEQEDPPREVCNKDETFTTSSTPGTSQIAFRSTRDGGFHPFAMDPDGSDPHNLREDAALVPGKPISWSPDGTKIAYSSNATGNEEILVVNADGSNPVNVTNTPTHEFDPAWSPDGSKIAFVSIDATQNRDIYVMDADGGNPVNITNSAGTDRSPSWSPDGERIAFQYAPPDECFEIWLMDADGSDRDQLTSEHCGTVPAWSPDGTMIGFSSLRDNNRQELYTINPDGSGAVRLTNDLDRDYFGGWSPDGARIVFHSNEPGDHDAFSIDSAGGDLTNLTLNAAEDEFPVWSPRPEADLPRRYVAMGDSVTQVGDPQRYPERFFSFLDGADEADILDNIGESGQTSGGMNGAQLAQANQLIDDPATDAAVVTIDIGGNDILGGPCHPLGSESLEACQPTLEAFSGNFETTFDSLDASLGNDPGAEQVIVMAYYNPWSGRSGQETTADRTEERLLGSDRTIDCEGMGVELGLNDHIACIGAHHGAKLADAYPPFLGHGTIGDYFDDTIHPNGTGHQVLADIFEDAVLTPGP